MATALREGGAGRGERRDLLLVALALGHGALLVAFPSAAVIGLGLWWSANTVAHNFIHRPFFRSRPANAVFSGYLSVLLGFPQEGWRRRHLAHHSGRRTVRGDGAALAREAALVGGLWLGLALAWPAFFLREYLPGYALGLCLCRLHGHYEHARGTTSYYGRLYNRLFLNDGYHVEHHARPSAHWSELPVRRAQGSSSRWPAMLRWLEELTLEGLERRTLASPRLQRFVVARHARAFRRLLPELPELRRVKIVGGGLFPRTALILRELQPNARLTIVDRSPENLATARRFLEGDDGVELVEGLYRPPPVEDADLVVVPLAYAGDRRQFYERPPAPVLVHDWIWRRRGGSVIVSWLLLKRLNLVRP